MRLFFCVSRITKKMFSKEGVGKKIKGRDGDIGGLSIERGSNLQTVQFHGVSRLHDVLI